MRNIITLALIILTMNLSAQEVNKKIIDETYDEEILINHCNRAGLRSIESFKEIFDPLYESYEPEESVVSELKKVLTTQKVQIILGTWCNDSKINVSQFYKVLDAANYKDELIEVIAVDGKKNTENKLTEKLDIKSVPTFIIYSAEGKELGRIIEHPANTLEADLLAILNKK